MAGTTGTETEPGRRRVADARTDAAAGDDRNETDAPDASGGLTVVVSVQHPAHVHFFRHALDELAARGHETHVFAQEKDVTVDLLDAYGIDHTVVGTRRSLGALPATQLAFEYRLWRATRALDPDVMTAVGGVAVSHVAALVGAESVVFTDTEHATLVNALAFPFADRVCTPECYRGDAGPGQHTYPGYHELAYLHPDRFDPDPRALDDAHVAPEDRYVVLRLVRWNATHNAGDGGLDDVHDAVSRLAATGAEVVISAEGDLPPDLESRRTTVATERVHDLLYYADLFVGESGTMTAESAVLGTPSVYVNANETGLAADLADYGVVYPHCGPDRHERAIETAEALLADPERVDWAARRRRLLADRRDTTDVVVEQVLDAGGAGGEEDGPGEADAGGDGHTTAEPEGRDRP
ncbi:MAG: DUF354 domain-containing protein [Haloarculaceae archaeon]